jgi:hypothetical protein
MSEHKPKRITADVPPELEPLVRRVAEVLWDDGQAEWKLRHRYAAASDGLKESLLQRARKSLATILQAGAEIRDLEPHGLACTHQDTVPAQLCLDCGAHRQDGPHEWRHLGGVTLPLFTVPVMQDGLVVGFISADAASASIHDGAKLGISIQEYVQPSQVVDDNEPQPDWSGCPCETCGHWSGAFASAEQCRDFSAEDAPGSCPELDDWMEKRGEE